MAMLNNQRVYPLYNLRLGLRLAVKLAVQQLQQGKPLLKRRGTF
jgi:hypothetical protein